MTEVRDKTKDPVCGERITKTQTEFSSEFRGRVYHFCSAECKAKFDRAPTSFVRLKAA